METFLHIVRTVFYSNPVAKHDEKLGWFWGRYNPRTKDFEETPMSAQEAEDADWHWSFR